MPYIVNDAIYRSYAIIITSYSKLCAVHHLQAPHLLCDGYVLPFDVTRFLYKVKLPLLSLCNFILCAFIM